MQSAQKYWPNFSAFNFFGNHHNRIKDCEFSCVVSLFEIENYRLNECVTNAPYHFNTISICGSAKKITLLFDIVWSLFLTLTLPSLCGFCANLNDLCLFDSALCLTLLDCSLVSLHFWNPYS